jgi:hypothetical protein
LAQRTAVSPSQESGQANGYFFDESFELLEVLDALLFCESLLELPLSVDGLSLFAAFLYESER